MVRITGYYLIAIFIVTSTGCVKDTRPDFGESKPLYVLEARISNMQGPYFVRVTRSTNSLGYQPAYPTAADADSAEPVKNALVIMTDDRGVADTLISAGSTNRAIVHYINRNGQLDSYTAFINDLPSPWYTADRGYYETTKITGAPGHTYHLTVRIDTSAFQASAYMPDIAPLDSTVLKETSIEPGKSSGYLPFVYFKEPRNEKNYYLLQYNNIDMYTSDNPYLFSYNPSIFPYYVVDDKILAPYVNGLPVRVIISAHSPYESGYPYIPSNATIQVRLSSLTEDAYRYFNALNEQFQDDGNVYRPVPSSPTGNISNGALGFFYATAVSYKLILPQ